MTTKNYQYRAFGLDIESELKLPLMTERFLSADVRIELGKTPSELAEPTKEGMRFQAARDEFLLRVDGVASYWISNGSKVVVEPESDSNLGDVTLFLLGSAIAAILQQRHILALHGSAISCGDHAIAFIGVSGSGKSTLAATLRAMGHRCLSDDICAITVQEGGPMLHPGYPQSKLWPDSLEALSVDPTGLARVRSEIEKRLTDWPHLFQAEPLPISKIFLLAPLAHQKSLHAKQLSPIESISVLNDHTFRKLFIGDKRIRDAYFRVVTGIATKVPVIQILRPKNSFDLNGIADLVLSAATR